MRIQFRQGIVRHQTDGSNNPVFLQKVGDKVNLLVSPDFTTIAFIHGTKDYLFTESVTVNDAWTSLPTGVDSWLYWDINKVTGLRTFGSTTVLPIVSSTTPVAPATGQMWFNTNVNMWYEFNSATWVEKIRVFAARLSGGSVLESMSINAPLFTGTQVGITTTQNVGSLAFDSTGTPIINQGGKFFTTEDVFTTGVPTGASLKVNNILVRGVAQEPIGAYQVVRFTDYDKLNLADPFDAVSSVYGIVESAVPTNDIANVITEGVVMNPAWDWDVAGGLINDPLYIDATGQLVLTADIPNQVPVASIIGKQTILFKLGIFGFGGAGGGTADHGSLLSLNGDDHLHYHTDARGDARYSLLTHDHVKADITDFVEGDYATALQGTTADSALQNVVEDTSPQLGGSLNAQSNQITALLDPTLAQDAATKAYVDAVAQGLSIKPAVRAGTTGNLVGTYDNGTLGVGATITADALVVFPDIDGVTGWSLNDGILVKDQTNAAHNGRYYISDLGSVGVSPWILTRCPKCDEAIEIPSSFVFVQEGTLNVGTGWAALVGDPSTFEVGTDAIDWTQFSTAGVITDHTGLTSIGTNTHATIDSHIADATIHFTQAAIDITESQINDLQSYLLNVVEDLTPQLGADLDSNDHNLTSAGIFQILQGGKVYDFRNDGVTINAADHVRLLSDTAIRLQSPDTVFSLNDDVDTIRMDAVNFNVNGFSTPGGITFRNAAGALEGTRLEQGSDNATAVLFRLPPDNGTVDYVLRTDGTGITSWVAQSGLANPLEANLDTNGYRIVTANVSTGNDAETIRIDAGDNSYASGGYYGGYVRINAGNGSNGNYGGPITINSGNSDTADGGYLNMYAGDSTSSAGGDIRIECGDSSSGDGGSMQLWGGNALTSGAVAGSVSIFSGSGNTVAAGADINLQAGGTNNAVAKGGDINLIPGGSLVAPHGSVAIHAGANQIGQASVQLWRDTNTGHTLGNFVGLKAGPTLAADITFTLPETDGTSGHVLQTDGNGVLSFAAAAGGSSNNWITGNNGSDFTVAPNAAGTNSLASGYGAYALGASSIALGGSYSAGLQSIAMGYQSIATGNYSTAIGYQATTPGVEAYGNVAIGSNVNAGGAGSIAIGISNTSSSNVGIVIGTQSNINASSNYSTVIGYQSVAAAYNQVVIGKNLNSASYNDVPANAQGSVIIGVGGSGGSADTNIVHIHDGGKIEPIGNKSMFVAPSYTLLTLPTVVAGGMIFVSDATGGGALTGSQCFSNGTVWIDVTTGIAVA